MHRGTILPDFAATIRIFTSEEGGRRGPTLNGIRWDFAYEEDGHPPREIYMIWPTFLDESGRVFEESRPVPAGVPVRAEMTVVIDAMRSQMHRGRIAPGVRFFCCEGSRRMASGVVTEVLNLPNDER